ncbi:MAG: efflux transporter outer membrane subunit [Planctomycetota bacterium]|nr:efflux transporter outer membrane subunit [Planctomycetota bacterium]
MRQRINSFPYALVSLALVLVGCEVGPNYARPKVEEPVVFKSQPQTRPAPPITADWWRLYHDDELAQLVATANESNQNLRQAVARVDQARALARVAASFLLPTVTADPSYTRVHTSANQPSGLTGKPSGSSVTYNSWQIPFDLAYEIDVWGRVRRSVEASAAQAAATADDMAVVRLTVTTDVATDYYALRALDAQEKIYQQTVTAYSDQLRLVSAQLRNGLVAPPDLYQAQAQLEATQAQLRDVQRARADEEHALAILCGRPASSFSVAANPLLEPAAPIVPAGLPGQLLTSRPDVAEAEQNVIAFNAQVGVATAEFYPTFTLTGTAGFESASAQHILDWQSKVASIGPSISVPIFEGGRLQSNLAAVKAEYQQSVAAYLNQVLIAYGDVEDALTDLHALADEVDRMRAAVEASQNYLMIARVQYNQGLVNYLIVVDAERTLLANQLTLSQDVNQQMSASIHVIKALGGGWSVDAHG